MSAETLVLKLNPKTDVFDIEQVKFMAKIVPSVEVVPGAYYRLEYTSTVKYNNCRLPMNKVVVYNTTDNNPNGWFYVVDVDHPQEIHIGDVGTQHNRLYAFLVDITSGDNTGEGILKATKLR